MSQTSTANSGSKILSNSAWMVFSNLVPIVAGIVSIPVIIEHLGTDRYGLLAIIWMFIGYLNLFDLGLSRGTTQFVSQYLERGDETGIHRLVWTTQIAMVVVGCVVGLALLLGANTLATEYLGAPAELQSEASTALKYLSYSLPFVIVSNGIKGVLQAYGDFRYLSLLSTPFAIAMYLVPAVVAMFTPDLVVIALALIAVRLLNFWLLAVRMLKFVQGLLSQFEFSKEEFMGVFAFGGWVSVSNIVSPLMRTLDRFFIASILGATAVAYYATPFEMITKLWIFPGAIVTVLFPMFSRQLEHNVQESIAVLKKSVTIISTLIYGACLIIAAVAPELITLWIDESFSHESYAILQILGIGVFINCVAYAFFAYVQGAGHPKRTAVLHLIELPCYLIALYLFTEPFGLIGVAWIWVIRVTADALIVVWMAQAIEDRLKQFCTSVFLVTLAAGTSLAVIVFIDDLIHRLIYMVVMGLTALALFFKAIPPREWISLLKRR